MSTERMLPYRQGKLDSLCGLYAAINAMRWATRDDNIEEEFWEEVFDSLVMCTDAHVGMAHVLIAGVGPKPLLKVLREVFGQLDFRFGRRFEAHRPFRAVPDCLREQLAWFTEQPKTGVMMIVEEGAPHWTVVRELDGQRLLLVDSDDRNEFNVAVNEDLCGRSVGGDLVRPKSTIVVECTRGR